MIEEAFLIRCLSPDVATNLIRPHLGFRENMLVVAPGPPFGVITVRATAAQLKEVRSVLDQYERGDAAACTTRP